MKKTELNALVVQLKAGYTDPGDVQLLPKPVDPFAMKPMQAYGEPSWAIVMYVKLEDEQAAFNLIAKPLFGPDAKEWSIMLLRPMRKDKADPLGQAGFIGLKKRVKP
jgi:hypothetical protein